MLKHLTFMLRVERLLLSLGFQRSKDTFVRRQPHALLTEVHWFYTRKRTNYFLTSPFFALSVASAAGLKEVRLGDDLVMSTAEIGVLLNESGSNWISQFDSREPSADNWFEVFENVVQNIEANLSPQLLDKDGARLLLETFSRQPAYTKIAKSLITSLG